MSIKKLLTITLLALPLSAFADDATEKDMQFGLQLGYASGGDTMLTVEFEDGSTDEIKAGSGLILGAYIQKTLTTSNDFVIDGHLGINYMSDSIDAENGDASFSRFPINALILARINKFSFGGGLTYHMNPNLELDFLGSSTDVEFDNALGFKAEVNYHFAGNSKTDYSLGLGYTNIDYELNNFSFDGSAFSLMMKAAF